MSRLLNMVLGCGLLAAGAGAGAVPDQPGTNVQTFLVQGVLKEIAPDRQRVVVAHEAIRDYMEAMTMPFKVKRPAELTGLRPGAKVLFHLKVTDTESWIEGISKTGSVRVDADNVSGAPVREPSAAKPRHPLMNYAFTNELGQAVRLRDFRGQALAITFFFTRCPIPDYCPRLSKNFEEASQKLAAMPSGPTNWHFLSVTFDPEFDTPQVLRAYGERYHYDPKHWSFVTGSKEKLGELARLSGVEFKPVSGLFNHNFRTLIIDPASHLQMIFPTSGNLSDAIVAEIVKAAAVPSSPARPSHREAAWQRP